MQKPRSVKSRIHIDFRKIDIWLGFCLGVIAHDLVSAYAPHGGHIPDLHAYYFAAPLLIISLLWREHRVGRWKAVFFFIALSGMLLTLAGIVNGAFGA